MEITNSSIRDRDTEKRLLYSNGKIAVIDEFTDTRIFNNIRFDGVFVVLCTHGGMTLDINGKMIKAQANDVVVGTPESIIGNAYLTVDFKFRGIFMSADYALQMLPLSFKGWTYKLFFEQNPKFTMSERDVDAFCRYYDLLKWKLSDTSNKYRNNVLDALLLALAYDFKGVFDGFEGLSPRMPSSAESIFNMFIDIISTSYPKPRNVAYYADKLNITAKYLSVVCRKTDGRTASKIIDAYVVDDIRKLLLTTRKSIKEISNELRFPNTSFFVRYVKKN